MSVGSLAALRVPSPRASREDLMLKLLRRFVSRSKVWGVHPTADVIEREEYLDVDALAAELGQDAARLREALEAGDVAGIRLDEQLWLAKRSAIAGYFAHCSPEHAASRTKNDDTTYTAAYAGLQHRR